MFISDTFFEFLCAFPAHELHCVGNKKQIAGNGYSTWDPRKANKNPGEVPQYDEIPYGDIGPNMGPNIGPSGKGQLPQVPDDYSQVPSIPQRQGIKND